MCNPPKVSILIPTYNYARFLPMALESVLLQDFSDFEILVSDDASTDNTMDILQPFVERDTRIRVHRHDRNIGMVANWNWCLKEARGSYIRFLFADDCFAMPHAMSSLVKMLDSFPDSAMAVSARFLMDEQSEIIGIQDDLSVSGQCAGREIARACMSANRNLIGEPSVALLRREYVQRGFLPGLKQMVDLEMWLYILMQGDMVYTHEPLCAFRRHRLQQTSRNRADCSVELEMIRIVQEYLPVALQGAKCPTMVEQEVVFQNRYSLRKHFGEKHTVLEQYAWLSSRAQFFWQGYFLALRKIIGPFRKIKESLQKRIRKKTWTNIYPEARNFFVKIGSNK